MVVFSLLKRHWRDARNAFEREKGLRVQKANFLSVYATAHTRALTPENIKAAFQKTGVVPFNPGVITATMTAPSLESSVHGTLPLPQVGAVQVLSQALLEDRQEAVPLGTPPVTCGTIKSGMHLP